MDLLLPVNLICYYIETIIEALRRNGHNGVVEVDDSEGDNYKMQWSHQ